MCVRLVLLACGTAFNVFTHKLCETQPPEFRDDKLASLEVTRVTSSFMIVTMGKNGATEGVFQGNINATPVGQDMIIVFPVGEPRLEGSRDVL